MKRAAVIVIALASLAHAAPAPFHSWDQMPTGNGFGFQVFDASKGKITQFLERPYKFMRPGATMQDAGALRRNLAYDAYFGARASGTGGWFSEAMLTEVGYFEQSGIIRAVSQVGVVKGESYFFAPFGLAANAMVMVIKATNTSAAPVDVDLFAIPNFHMGAAPNPDMPTAVGEQITTLGGIGTESGPGGGAMVYVPLSGFDKADCSGTGYSRVKAGQDLLGAPQSCSGDDQTLIYQKTRAALGAGETIYWGLIVAFAPTDATATRDAVTTFIGPRTAQQLLDDARAEWTAWHSPPPAGLSQDEQHIYRQSEAVMRMAQVLEPYSTTPKQKGYGMLLAALPPGIWHIGWVRDAQYALVALSRA
jgi:hypothetical protein